MIIAKNAKLTRVRYMKLLYKMGLLLSAGAGIWHFTVPYLYKWYSYIPDAPIEIIRSIDWINYFFSLLLTGLSVILFVYAKRAFDQNKEALVFYGFMVFVWFNRVIITIILPWNYDILFAGQLAAFILIFVIQLIPLIHLVKACKQREQADVKAGPE